MEKPWHHVESERHGKRDAGFDFFEGGLQLGMLEFS
jgi:hypothetical protein